MKNIMIDVKSKDGYKFMVVIEGKDSEFEYEVVLDEKYYQYLTKGRISKEKLIKKSFEFLLRREPKESILFNFNGGAE